MTTAIDSVGGHNGTYQGPWCGAYGLVPGNDLSAYAQNFSASYVLLPDTAFPCLPAHDWSIVGVANTGLGSPILAYFAWDVSTKYIYVTIGSSPRNLILQFPESPSSAQVVGTTNIVPGTTHLFVATFQLASSTFSIYMDGALEGSAVHTGHGNGGATTPVFAAFGANDGVVASAQATFDEFALYNVCLTAGNVATLQAARSNFSAFSATVRGLGANSLYHLDELTPCPGVVVVTSGWHVGRIGMSA